MASEKEWDHDKPFARIGSPSANRREQADGRGFARGAHSTKYGPTVGGDGPFDAMAGDLMRSIPNWVSVEAEDRVEELEGKLDRSFQTWTDYPPVQWHQWYDWNFHIAPDPPYAFLRGKGNEGPPDAKRKAELERERLATGRRPVSEAGTMECEWDAGAFGIRHGLMFGGQVPWPMRGTQIWMAGRWIYDCGHSTNDDEPEGPNQGLMRSELHPLKAVAFAWWEAWRFKENGDLYVPAIRFMFFMSRFGGYYDFPAINDGDANGNDYEFIVDLPELVAPETRHAVGHTPDFPLNTIVFRSKLVKHFDFDSFDAATGTHEDQADIEPIVEELAPDDPGSTKRQVKITIPCTQLPAGTDYYGVIVSLGWQDPDGAQAKKIKRCTVTLRNVLKGSLDHDNLSEEWVFKACVNHRWYLWEFDWVFNNQVLELGDRQVDLWLHEDETIKFSSHGADLDATHDAMRIGPLRVDGAEAVWSPDIDSFNVGLAGQPHSRDRPDYVQARRVLDALTAMFMEEFTAIGAIAIATDESDPLGIIDPGKGPASDLPLNPLHINEQPEFVRSIELHAYWTAADPHSAELTERTGGRPDYTLRIHVHVQPQAVPGQEG